MRGDRAKEISKGLLRYSPRLNITMGEDGFVDMGALLRAPRFWRQWVTEEEIIDVIHHNHKSRLEVRREDGTDSVRALQGHSISHVRDDLILTKLSVADTPEYAAHGTFYIPSKRRCLGIVSNAAARSSVTCIPPISCFSVEPANLSCRVLCCARHWARTKAQ